MVAEGNSDLAPLIKSPVEHQTQDSQQEQSSAKGEIARLSLD
jgi:hypothetical protein